MKMKKSFVLLLMAITAIILVACSGTKTKDEGAGASKKEEEKTRIIKTVQGDVEVPAHPKRVIVDWNLGDVLAVGVKPIATTQTMLDYGVLLKPFRGDDIKDIGSDGQTSVEKMLTLKPDLIITYDTKAVEKYKKIAPTVVYDSSKYPTIQEKVVAMGEILNRQKEAAAFNEELDKKIVDAKERIAKVIPKNATISIIDVGTVKTALVVGKTGERGGDTIYQLLGMKPQENVKKDLIDKGESRIDVSWEKINHYAGDYIVEITTSDAKFKRPEIWDTLDAVKKGNIISVDIHSYFMSDPLTASLQIDDLVERIEKLKK